MSRKHKQPVDGIEVTPEMVDAGFHAFAKYDLEDLAVSNPDPMIEDVIRAALQAARRFPA